ncbi:MAG: hypothetical protein ABL974_08755 [Prosthecobacter sp.]
MREPFWSWNRFTERRMASQMADAAHAWDIWKDGSESPTRRNQAEIKYERAVSAILKEWGQRQLPRTWQTGSVFVNGSGSYRVDLQPAPGNPQEVSPLMFDRLRLAEDVHVGRNHDVIEAGIGVPVVGEISYSETLAKKYPLMPLNGGHLTLTALLQFEPAPKDSKAPRVARLHLYNPLRQNTLMLGQRKIALAANYSAAKKLALDDGFLKSFSLIGALFPEKTIKDSQIYRLELHDPKRIPVVFVHGLLSDPHIWYQCINAMYADPVLRANFQPWYFLYPTGMAVPSTARRLRELLEEAKTQLDPDHNDPGMKEMVLVGHSMGGLLSRMQTIDSGDDFWNAYFKKKPAEMHLTDGARERLTKSLIFTKEPSVKRLIFIAVPQRGSAYADKGIVYRISTLIRLPFDSLLLVKEILTGNPDALNQQVRDWGAFAFLSVGTLSPKHPYLHALNDKPITVPHHSIIGRVGKQPLEQSSDRVVAYSSSHLETGTEAVVPCWHGCVEEPIVIKEVLKRLHEHLKKLGRE